MPTIYQDRSAISLYDEQHDANGNKIPIPNAVITEIVAALARFKSTCQEYGVKPDHIKVVATEATRRAMNRDDMLQRILQGTGWSVSLLSKEEEGAIGAAGIASSVDHVHGVCIDMGGGSLQLTPVLTQPDGDILLGPSHSYPYGAAALMKYFDKPDNIKLMAQLHLMETLLGIAMERYLQDSSVRIASEDAGGVKLYLSGGGFRGLGHFLMSREKRWFRHYPIPFVNGFIVDGATFFSAALHHGNEPETTTTSHRISARRQSQLPAVQSVVEALLRTGIPVSQVIFAQGGVREGLIYKDLPDSIRALSPVVAATIQYQSSSAATLYDLLRKGSPGEFGNDPLLQAITNLLYAHGNLTKDVRAVAALRSTTVGLLAGAHGLSHYDRATLALVLCERWGGKIPSADIEFSDDMAQICSPHMRWYAKFVGRMAKGIANLYPAGIVGLGNEKVSIVTSFPFTSSDASDRKWCSVLLVVLAQGPEVMSTVLEWKADLEKLSKPKNWGSNPKWGLAVEVSVMGPLVPDYHA